MEFEVGSKFYAYSRYGKVTRYVLEIDKDKQMVLGSSSLNNPSSPQWFHFYQCYLVDEFGNEACLRCNNLHAPSSEESLEKLKKKIIAATIAIVNDFVNPLVEISAKHVVNSVIKKPD